MIVKIAGPLTIEHLSRTGFWVDPNEIVIDHLICKDKLSATFHLGPISVTFDHKELDGMHETTRHYKEEKHD